MEDACPFMPCCSPEQDFSVVGAAHSGLDCPIVEIQYDKELVLALTLELRWRALIGEDRSLFVVKDTQAKAVRMLKAGGGVSKAKMDAADLPSRHSRWKPETPLEGHSCPSTLSLVVPCERRCGGP